MSYLVPILIILLLILVNGLYVAAEFAVVGSRKARVDRLASEGKAGASYVQAILASTPNQDRYIAVAQLGITLASIGLGMYGERSIASWLYGPLEHLGGLAEPLAHSIGTVVAVAILTYFHVVVGEMIPKALALQAPEATALRISLPMRLSAVLLAPLVWLLNGVGNLVLRLLRVPLSGHGQIYSVRELEQLVDESAESGEVAERQHELIDNIFTFGEREASQLMTPRPRIVGLELASSEAEVLEAIQEGYSRLPIYRDSLDHIVGILHVKDFIKAHTQGQPFELTKLMRRAPRVPEHLAAETLLEAFKRLKVHMAVVMNEYGGTAGVVTLEDLLEEVVGELQDEFDDEDQELQELAPGRWQLPGHYLIDDLNRQFELELPTEPSETIGGLVVDALGRAPETGDELTLPGLKMTVQSVDGLAVERLLLELPQSPQAGEALDEASRSEAE